MFWSDGALGVVSTELRSNDAGAQRKGAGASRRHAPRCVPLPGIRGPAGLLPARLAALAATTASAATATTEAATTSATAAAAETTPTAAATEAPASATATSGRGTRLVHSQPAPIELGFVELLDCGARAVFRGHFHEAKPTGPARRLIAHDPH